MAKSKPITVVLLQDFAGKSTGETLTLGAEIAVSVVRRGIAKYEEAKAIKEIKLKTTKKKKDEKNNDLTAD